MIETAFGYPFDAKVSDDFRKELFWNDKSNPSLPLVLCMLSHKAIAYR
jgi:hypothetical protein